MKYGYFDNEKREYILTNPNTPVKWINFIGSLQFGGFVDHTGGACICRKDPALNRITKYIPQLPDSNMKGETIYIRFKKDGTYKIFSPFCYPTMDDYELYECHIGIQYTRIISIFYNIRTEITIFIPIDSNVEIRSIKVSNLSKEILDIDVIPVVEYSHFDALKQLINADWVPQTMQSRVIKKKGSPFILTQYAFINKERQINYFTSNYDISSFETDRRLFIRGKDSFGNWALPLGLLNNEFKNTEANRGDIIAAALHRLGEIKPGEEVRIITQLGQVENIEGAIPQIEAFRKESEVDSAFDKIKEFWNGYLSKFQVETPDNDFDTMINIHNPRQCYITMNWSRYLSLYQLGFGARGIGVRDTSQDIMSTFISKPEQGQELLLKLFQMQKRDGSAMHQFNPLTMIGTIGEAKEKADRPDYYGDDHLWIILATCAYLKETGDIKLLQQVLPFYDKDKTEYPLEYSTVLYHMDRAIEFTFNKLGKHNLPLLGYADWNDTVNLMPGAESLFIANLFGVALKEMIELADFIEKEDSKRKYERYYNSMKKYVNESGWDGKWYLRYFDADGTPIGSNNNKEGKIYANAQSWPIISGFAPIDRSKEALEAVFKNLNTKNGIKLSWPGFNRYDRSKGGITTYPPGAKENGGIFLHTNPWVIIAETIVGNGERAFHYYAQINPISKNDKIEEYECEPYCYAQNILGDEHPQFGLARNTWLTGTASWMYRAATEYILGIKPTYGGLKIDPCIPPGWSGFKVTRTFRGIIYEIQVKNPNKISKGIKQIEINGNILNSNILPITDQKGPIKVIVIMGK